MKRVPSFFAVFAASATLLCAQEAAKQPEPVHFSKILPLLPAVPSDWTAADPDGSVTDTGNFKMTTAGRTYSKGDGENVATVSVTIIDYAGNKQFYDATTAAWNATQETAEGYTKPVKLGEYPGFETWDKGSKSGSLWVELGGRFFVHIDTTNLDSVEMQAWMKQIDLKKLAVLK